MNPDAIEKKCPHCGKDVPASARYCPECGQALTGKVSGEKTDQLLVEKKKPNIWLPVLPLFILAGLCLIVVFLVIRATPPAMLASGLGTVAAVGKPTQTPSPTPTAMPSSTPTPTPPATPTATPTATPPPMPPAEAKAKDIWVSPLDGMEIVYIPAGHYVIGSLDSDPDAFIYEKPQHGVDLSGYWMDKTLVTNAMYAKCVQVGACPAHKMNISYTRDSYYGNAEFDTYPVIYVTWDEAQTYCTWAGRKLPTDAQWEVAARGRDERKYPWGNSPPSCNLLNYTITISTNGGLSNTCKGDTTAVGKYPQGASPYGLMDMAGNVWEWVADWLGPNYLVEPHENPLGPATGELRVLRGGFYFGAAKYVRIAVRIGHDPNDATDFIGFRCAR